MMHVPKYVYDLLVIRELRCINERGKDEYQLSTRSQQIVRSVLRLWLADGVKDELDRLRYNLLQLTCER